jgi:hypothetical protein
VRIARDLHDSVAHSMASISVQAGVGAPTCWTDDWRTVSISLGHPLAGVGGRFGQQIQVGCELLDCHPDGGQRPDRPEDHGLQCQPDVLEHPGKLTHTSASAVAPGSSLASTGARGVGQGVGQALLPEASPGLVMVMSASRRPLAYDHAVGPAPPGR